MAKLSRTEKYRELREKLQSDPDTETKINSPDLSRYEKRLNQIDADNFAAPSETNRGRTNGSHARIEPSTNSLRQQPKTEDDSSHFAQLSNNENYTKPAYDNDFLNRYIQEVKQYNIDQGNAVSDKTEVNVLSQLNNSGYDSRRAYRPFNRESVESKPVNDDFEDTGELPVVQSKKPDDQEDTASLDYTAQLHPRARSMPVQQPAAQTDSRQERRQASYPAHDFTDDLDFDDEGEEPGVQPDDQNMTKEDIMAQVQSMVNHTGGNNRSQPVNSSSAASDKNKPDTRQQLLKETSQMRAQLDNYEDNLNDVSDKMRHTNHILNVVLIVLIVALAVVLAVVVYWIVRG